MPAFIPHKTGPYVLSVNTSSGGIPKQPQASVMALKDGLEGDGRNHAKHIRPDRAISLWDYELLLAFVAEGFSLTPGAAGENLTVKNLNVQSMSPGMLLRVGEAVLKLEQPRKPCYVLDAIDPQLKDVVVGRIGFLASVVQEGMIRPGMPIEVIVGLAESTPMQTPNAPTAFLNAEPRGHSHRNTGLSPFVLAGRATG
jgi:MOSC domain-containing protein YiiM